MKMIDKIMCYIPSSIKRAIFEHELRDCESKLQYHQMMAEYFRSRVSEISESLEKLGKRHDR